MKTYEVEIKSLLGSEDRADNFRSLIQEKGAVFVSTGKQLNHYFINGNLLKMKELLFPYFEKAQQESLEYIISHGEHFSVRVRNADGTVLIVVKATTGDNTSENGIARMEFEEQVSLNIDELDKLLLDADFQYQAKWSRTRETYTYDDITITLDRNAGYGWLTEFELVVSEESEVQDAQERIKETMESFGVEELDQERLSRMFDYYNKNWREYYGTDNIFNIE